jgi:diguanylate cyclase (GGDEF)-like protein
MLKSSRADGETVDLEPHVARELLAAWASVAPSELSATPDHIVVLLARRLIELPPGHAEGDPQVTSAILRDLLSEMHRQASTDPLTGLATRRAIQDRLAMELSRAARYCRDIGLLLIDVDGLKQINDLHGHQAGDAVLSAAASALVEGLRAADVAGRWGGDEFLVVCPEASAAAAAAVAEKVITRLSARNIPCHGASLSLSASAGWVSAPGGGPVGLLLGWADAALYAAKAQGGGCAVGYTSQAEQAATA